MIVLSLFDGISTGYIALERAGIKVDKYYASEIEKDAIKISKANYPNIIQLGDVTKWKEWNIETPDIIIGGSPCQNLSFAGDGTGLKGKKSKLFFDFVDILNHYNPDYFMLENTMMKKENEEIITKYMGVNPIKIDSALVSAQSRKRNYWTNIPGITQPEDRGIFLKDIVFEDGYPVVLHNIYGGFKESTPRVFLDKSPTLRTAAGGGHIPSFIKKDWLHTDAAIEYMNRITGDGRKKWDFKFRSDVRSDKSACMVANLFKGVPCNVLKDWDCIRKFHPGECELLQTLPLGYTHVEGVSNTSRYKAIGNGWSVETVAHIFKHLK